MHAHSRHYGLIPAGIILLAALLALAEVPHKEGGGEIQEVYENAHFGFSLSYLAGSTKAQRSDDDSVSFVRNGAMLEIDVYEPQPGERDLTLGEFVARAVEGAEVVGPTRIGEEEAMVALFRKGTLRIGGGIHLGEASDVIFVKRPTYYVYAVLRGGTLEERRELANILHSIRFQ